MAMVLISIGSNLGSRLPNCVKGLKRLNSLGIKVERASPWFLSEPLGPPQPWFINGAALISTPLSPPTLLTRLQEVEEEMGRRGKGKGTPRTLDLDIILYGDMVMDSEWLTLPHPRFRERRFVLEPLAAIAPRVKDPITGLRIGELLEICPDPSRVIPLQTGGQPGEFALQFPPGYPERPPGAFWCHL